HSAREKVLRHQMLEHNKNRLEKCLHGLTSGDKHESIWMIAVGPFYEGGSSKGPLLCEVTCYGESLYCLFPVSMGVEGSLPHSAHEPGYALMLKPSIFPTSQVKPERWWLWQCVTISLSAVMPLLAR